MSHLPASALPGASQFLLDPAAQRIALQVFAPRARSAGNNELLDPVEPFSAPALLNGWVNFGGGYNNAGFYKDRQGIVHLRGLLKSGTLTLPAFVLPAGYRPVAQEFFATVSNFAFGSIYIEPNGNVSPYNGSNVFIGLDGITFRAA